MRFQLVFFILIFSMLAFGSSQEESEVKELFKKYDLVMKERKTEYIEEVFSQKFLKQNGGKEGFAEKLKELPFEKSNPPKLKWKKGNKDDIYLVKFKNGKDHSHSQFILIKEDGKIKIDGTISDSE